jgi:iron complex outermembrane recepter protein
MIFRQQNPCREGWSRAITRGPGARIGIYRLAGLLLAVAVLPCRALPQGSGELLDLSFDQLADIRITSVSKSSERLAEAAASVFVITSDDLRRSGAASLPEALRLAPNLQVAEASAYGYTISARGFNSSAANKLLVLIDGRSVYTPLFSGVFWDAQDVMLDDVERIEVISGPGGTLWGTNAVNGVINIITRSSANTQGGIVSAGGGNRQSDGALRYGAKLDSGLTYRIYAKYTDRRHTSLATGDPIDDGAHRAQAGFRADWRQGADRFTVQGDAYRGVEDQPLPGMIAISGLHLALGPIKLDGANLNARWERQLEAGGHLSLHLIEDHTERTVPPTFGEALDIVDFQLQHNLAPIGMHALVWGAAYRYSIDRVRNSRYIAFLPADVNQAWTSLFAQDELSLRADLRLTVGARLERNDYTGVEVLPNARLAWTPAPAHTLWGALSRTVRAPSRYDRDIYVPGGPPFLLDGGSTVTSESAQVAELGYRGQPTATLSYSVTAFHARYDDLRTQEIAPSRTYFYFANKMEGSTRGIEMWGTWQVMPHWRLNAGMNALHEGLRLRPGSNDPVATATAGLDPAHQWLLRSSLDLDGQRSLDCTLRHVAALSNPDVPAYTSVDVRYGWRPRPDWELSIAGQHLNGGGHAEFTSAATRSHFGRGVYAKAVYRF